MNVRDFYWLIEHLKTTKRRGWVDRGLDADSIAAHIYGAMALGWFIAKEEGVDQYKVVEMLLVHDLVMSKMVDVTPATGRYQEKEHMEEEAKNQVAEILPGDLKEKYLSLFDEFQAVQTKEAQVAREADKLETLLQGEAYEAETGRYDILDEFLGTYMNVFTTKIGKQIYEEISVRHEERKESAQQ